MAFCLGPFCGKFRDELGGESDSEEEDDGTSMRAKNKKKVKRKRPKKSERNVASTNMMWAPYLSESRILVKGRNGAEELKAVTQLKTPYNLNVSENMLNRINQLQQVEIIEISKCNLERIPPSLEELDGLMMLILSYNNIRKFSMELARCETLERIVLDWNQIGEVEPGIFSDLNFPRLQVVNLSHNRLSILPADFPRTAANDLQYVDLSYNQLTSVPTALMQCRQLQELNLSHNKLTQLPEVYELKKLKKLFLSFNELVALPANIGISENLEKLRITSNQIKRLPYSILDLWKKATPPGKLEELLVDRNPLQVPSITAFEMVGGAGGMDRAFHLLQEDKAESLTQKAQPALEEREATPQLALPAPAVQAPQSVTHQSPREDELSGEDPWYFGHLANDKAKIMEIREAEQHFLVRKRHAFLAVQRKLAKDEQEARQQVSEHMQVFLDEKSYTKYSGRVKTQDSDHFFILFIFAAKPAYKSAHAWFERFAGPKGYMTKSEWYELCLNSPLDVRQKGQDDLWATLFDPAVNPKGLTEAYFIAACQIHDIEARDPYIVRVADALSLDYFETPLSEIQLALDPSGLKDKKEDILTRTREMDDAAGLTAHKLAVHDEGADNLGLKDLLKKVSLTDYDFHQVHHLDGIEEGSAVESEQTRYSAELSEDETSDISEFDAQASLLEEQEQSQQAMAKAPTRFAISGDSSLRRLMEAPLEEIFRGRKEALRAVESTQAYKKQVLTKPVRNNRTSFDELAVRRALRDVYRSMPFHDFTSFINFLLRALHAVKEDKVDRAKSLSPLWHDDDPSFRYAVGPAGQNKYTPRLLRIMGFVHLNDQYWVWPTVHLRSKGRCWAHLQVAPDCPGLLQTRLEQMIDVLGQCLVAINDKGASFTGYFDVA
ncbi:unnamed protein product [Effrenium voratum]|nr:unnamed protein product [Effrenium voratum]